jgi:hypothetical protein
MTSERFTPRAFSLETKLNNSHLITKAFDNLSHLKEKEEKLERNFKSVMENYHKQKDIIENLYTP